MSTIIRLDAAESRYFSRQQESIDRTTYKAVYPENQARSFLPVVADVDEYAAAYTWRMTERVGRAKVGGSSSDDMPRVDVFGTEKTVNITEITASYGFSILEIQRAAKAGTNLDSERGTACRESIEDEIDLILASGHTAKGFKGLLNLASTLTYTLATKRAGGKTWAVATPDEILADLNGMASYVIQQQKAAIDALRANGDANAKMFTNLEVVMPVSQYMLIATLSLGDGRSDTVLSYILRTSPVIKKISAWWRAAGAGDTATDRIVMYANNSKVLGALVPMEYRTFDPQQKNLDYVVPAMARTGGVICRYPFAVCYADGS